MRTKLLLVGTLAIAILGSAAAAEARVVIDPVISIGGPPVYVAPPPPPPPPVYGYGYIGHPYVTGYDPYHRRSDWRYWQHRHWEREHGHY